MVICVAKGLLTHLLTHGVTETCTLSTMRFFMDTFRMTHDHPLS